MGRILFLFRRRRFPLSNILHLFISHAILCPAAPRLVQPVIAAKAAQRLFH
jgi:hypothetical protein